MKKYYKCVYYVKGWDNRIQFYHGEEHKVINFVADKYNKDYIREPSFIEITKEQFETERKAYQSIGKNIELIKL